MSESLEAALKLVRTALADPTATCIPNACWDAAGDGLLRCYGLVPWPAGTAFGSDERDVILDRTDPDVGELYYRELDRRASDRDWFIELATAGIKAQLEKRPDAKITMLWPVKYP